MNPIISVSHFSQSFNGKVVIDDINFSVFPGEVFAYLGSNGSGKTTTIRCLLGMYPVTAGILTFWGESFHSRFFHKIGYLPEERGLYLGNTVQDVMVFFAQLRGMSRFDAITRTNNYLDRVGLSDKKTTKIKYLSSGQQQKIQFGVATIHDPEVLILDEPMKGLDPVNRQFFIEMFLEHKARGATILFSSHQMDDVEKLADTLLILSSGKIGAYGTIDAVKKQFGKHTIKVLFSGDFPHNNALFQVKISHNYAEIFPLLGIGEQEILQFLVKKGLILHRFEVSLPSLNDIFISINQSYA